MFLGEHGLSTSGVVLNLGGAKNVKIVFAALLGDEEALNLMWHIKGASGVCPCGVLCNVTNKQRPEDVARGIKSLSDIDPSIQDISSADLNLCGRRSDEDVWNGCDLLAASPPNLLDEREHCSGLKLHLSTVLHDKPLRPFVKPASTTTFDPMHVLFSNGLLSSEIMLFMRKMKESTGAYFADVRAFHEASQWMPSKLQAFSEVRERNSHDMLKCGASELLDAYPLLRAFILATYGSNAPEPHVVSIMLLFEICDEVRSLLKHCRRRTQVEATVARLEKHVRAYLVGFVKAYGRDAVRFKHHMVLHLPEQILRNGLMLNCWCCERKNKSTKSAITQQKTPCYIQTTGLSRMLADQLRRLEDPGWSSMLTPPVNAFPELAASLGHAEVDISGAMRFQGTSLRSGEFAFMDYERTNLIQVVACWRSRDANSPGCFGLLVRCCQHVSCSATGTSSTWQADQEVKNYRLQTDEEHVAKPAFHRCPASGRIELLH